MTDNTLREAILTEAADAIEAKRGGAGSEFDVGLDCGLENAAMIVRSLIPTTQPTDSTGLIGRLQSHFADCPQRSGEKSFTRMLLDEAAASLATKDAEIAALREALDDNGGAAFDKAWANHCNSVDRCNAARPDIQATRAERAVYDERYKVMEEARRDWLSEGVKYAKARAALGAKP